MTLPANIEAMCLSAKRDLRVIEALARRGTWDPDACEMMLYLVGRVRELEAESHGRMVTINRLVGGSTESQERALARRADHGDPSGEWTRPANGGAA